MKKLFLVLALGFGLWRLDGFAATYYVAPSTATPAGSDSNNGSSGAPWLTINHANSPNVAVGDTVIVRDGVYQRATSDSVANLSTAGVTYKSENYLGAQIDGNGVDKYGFRVNANNIVVEGFDFFHQYSALGTGGIRMVGTAGDIVRHNRFRDIGNVCTDTDQGIVGIELQSSNGIVERNIFYNIGRLRPNENGSNCAPTQTYYKNVDHGIYSGQNPNQNNNIIRNNIFYDLDNGWAIQLYPNAISGTKILNNVFADANPDRIGKITISTSLTNVDISNNIFYNPLTAGVRLSSGTHSGVTIRNNLSTTSNVFWSEVTNNSTPPAGVTVTGSIVSTTPNFVAAGSRDYHINSSSAAKDAGLTLTDVTTDYDLFTRPQPVGGSYDIGAYEYIVSLPPPLSTISLTYPIGGENILLGTAINITWTSNDTHTVKLELSRDGGTTYPELIATGIAQTADSNNSYSWTTTVPQSYLARIRVTNLNDLVNSTSSSNVNFRGNYVK